MACSLPGLLPFVGTLLCNNCICLLSSHLILPSHLQVLENINWPAEMPFGPDDFQRYDESTDDIFYSQPRFVTHIDDGAIGALTECARALGALSHSASSQ